MVWNKRIEKENLYVEYVVWLVITGLNSAVFNSDLQGHTQVNFVSTLLQVTMSDNLDLPVRQAGELRLTCKNNSAFGNIIN